MVGGPRAFEGNWKHWGGTGSTGGELGVPLQAGGHLSPPPPHPKDPGVQLGMSWTPIPQGQDFFLGGGGHRGHPPPTPPPPNPRPIIFFLGGGGPHHLIDLPVGAAAQALQNLEIFLGVPGGDAKVMGVHVDGPPLPPPPPPPQNPSAHTPTPPAHRCEAERREVAGGGGCPPPTHPHPPRRPPRRHRGGRGN